jgi:hypothetical protein
VLGGLIADLAKIVAADAGNASRVDAEINSALLQCATQYAASQLVAGAQNPDTDGVFTAQAGGILVDFRAKDAGGPQWEGPSIYGKATITGYLTAADGPAGECVGDARYQSLASNFQRLSVATRDGGVTLHAPAAGDEASAISDLIIGGGGADTPGARCRGRRRFASHRARRRPQRVLPAATLQSVPAPVSPAGPTGLALNMRHGRSSHDHGRRAGSISVYRILREQMSTPSRCDVSSEAGQVSKEVDVAGVRPARRT